MRMIEKILKAKESRLPGDFIVYRALPRRERRRVGGFVFLDHFDHADVTPEIFDVPPHPHVGLQTVTYLFAGKILHTDSLHYEQLICPGDINWMTAGKGITHAEQVIETQSRVHGLQSWVGLPHKDRSTEPGFGHFNRSVLPTFEKDGFHISVLAGECGRYRSPIPTFQELFYLDISTEQQTGTILELNPAYELAIYVAEGVVQVGKEQLGVHDLGLLAAGDSVHFQAEKHSRFVILGGEPLPNPTVIYWNFVTDTIGQAERHMADWEAGKFPSVRRYLKRSEEPSDKATMQLL